MPKRSIEDIHRKIKKLQKKLKRRRRRRPRSTTDSDSDIEQVGDILDSPEARTITEHIGAATQHPDNPLSLEDILDSPEAQPITEHIGAATQLPDNPLSVGDILDSPDAQTITAHAGVATQHPDNPLPVTLEKGTADLVSTNDEGPSENLDPELLDILGADPSSVIKYGPPIHKQLSSRLQHMATEGLTTETRKELTERYLIPDNSTLIGAPLLNAEIKAAVTDTVLKRDKGIEARQNQLAAAIAGLARVLTMEIDSKNKDHDRIKQLMDISKILCNIQHAESVTRRNFAIFSIKKDLKDHLTDTKIDKYLFGENLAETIRSAKAVSKSGTELKNRTQQNPKTFPPATNLNWRSPAPARKQQGTRQGAQRGRGSAPPPVPGHSARYNRYMMQGNSSKASRHQSKPTRRR